MNKNAKKQVRTYPKIDENLSVLLIDLDLDMSGDIHTVDIFQSANPALLGAFLEFQEQVIAWSKATDVMLRLEIVVEDIKEEYKYASGLLTSSSHTRVYGIFESDMDKAFYKLNMKQFKICQRIFNGKFVWEN